MQTKTHSRPINHIIRIIVAHRTTILRGIIEPHIKGHFHEKPRACRKVGPPDPATTDATIAKFVQRSVLRILSNKKMFDKMINEDKGLGMSLFFYFTATEAASAMEIGSVLYFGRRIVPLIEKHCTEEEKAVLLGHFEPLNETLLNKLLETQKLANAEDNTGLSNVIKAIRFSLDQPPIARDQTTIDDKKGTASAPAPK